MIPPVLRHAARARRLLSGNELRVLIELFEHLDYLSFRRLKLVEVALPLSMREPNVSRALRQLRAAGCVERAESSTGALYRLCVSAPRPALAALSPAQHAARRATPARAARALPSEP